MHGPRKLIPHCRFTDDSVAVISVTGQQYYSVRNSVFRIGGEHYFECIEGIIKWKSPTIAGLFSTKNKIYQKRSHQNLNSAATVDFIGISSRGRI